MRILIAGAGMVGRRLAAQLATGRHDVTIVDLNRELCDAVAAQYGVIAISGNATDIGTLEEAEIGRVDVAVGLMGLSADNLAFSLLAHSSGVGRIIARMPNPRYRSAYERAGVTSILDATSLFLDRLILEIERPQTHHVATIADAQGIIVWVRVADGSAASGRTVDQLRADRRFPRGCAVCGLLRGEGGRFLLPSGRDRVLSGDEMLLVGTIDGVTRAADLFGNRQGLVSHLLHRRQRSVESEEAHARVEAEVDPESEADDPQDEARDIAITES